MIYLEIKTLTVTWEVWIGHKDQEEEIGEKGFDLGRSIYTSLVVH